MSLRKAIPAFLGLALAALAVTGAGAKTIWTFSGPDGRVGGGPTIQQVKLLLSQGSLFGVTGAGGANDRGAVFKLTPPGCSDGSDPVAGLLVRNGSLYGTASGGGAFDKGVVFRLTPPKHGHTGWTYAVLYSFSGGADGGSPFSPLIADKTGALYGTTYVGGEKTCTDRFGNVRSCGTVFKLTPPAPSATTWTQTVLYAFPAGGANGAFPMAGLVNMGGDLYGTTSVGGPFGFESPVSNGVAFKLSPPGPSQTDWTYTMLAGFGETVDDAYFLPSGLLAYKNSIYGASNNGGSCGQGAVFKLTPSADHSHWNKTIIYSFGARIACGPDADAAGPWGGLIVKEGVLYGAAGGGDIVAGELIRCGTVYRLTPDSSAPTHWAESIDYAFDPPSCPYPGSNPVADDGGDPVGDLLDGGSVIYGFSGGGINNKGTVFQVNP